MTRRPIVLLVLLSLLTSCQPEKPLARWEATAPEVGGSRDRQVIAAAVDEIQAFAAARGLPGHFHGVEIRVVNEFSGSFADIEASGVCYPGERPFIEIRKSVFDDPEEAWNIVAHELGHCVLNRPHDDAIMSGGGYRVAIRRGRGIYDGAGLSVSVMSARGNRMAPRAYYLRELFGLERLTSLRELARRYPRSVVVE